MSRFDDPDYGCAFTVLVDPFFHYATGDWGLWLGHNIFQAGAIGYYEMAEAAVTLSMFVMWAWVDEATYDGKTFAYSVQLDGAIDHLTITGTLSA